jgi:hypothetical protein
VAADLAVVVRLAGTGWGEGLAAGLPPGRLPTSAAASRLDPVVAIEVERAVVRVAAAGDRLAQPAEVVGHGSFPIG